MDSPLVDRMPRKLIFEYLVYIFTSMAMAIGFRSLLAANLDSKSADSWFLIASTVLIYQWAHLGINLSKNRLSEHSRILPTFGCASPISFLRLVSIAFLAAFLFFPEPVNWLAWLPALLYLVAISSDLIDGYVARITNSVTILGQELDEVLDGRGLMVTSLLAWHYGRVGWWFLGIGLARYLYLFGLYRRKQLGETTYSLQTNLNRRALAGTQMVFSMAILVPLFSPPETIWISTIFMLPFLINFQLDWWQVSGRHAASQKWKNFAEKYLMPALPTFLLVARIIVLFSVLFRFLIIEAPNWVSILEIILAVLISIGFLGQTAAALLLIETGLRQQLGPLGPFDWILFILTIAILFFGPGRGAKFSPEANWVQQRAGDEN